jgi:hypothetical protein
VYDSKEKHNSRTHFEKPQGKNPTELEGGLWEHLPSGQHEEINS